MASITASATAVTGFRVHERPADEADAQYHMHAHRTSAENHRQNPLLN
jgi:hypothetical protein